MRYLIEAMPDIIKKYADSKLMIIASWQLEKELKDIVVRLKIKNNIIFVRDVNNAELPKYYAI